VLQLIKSKCILILLYGLEPFDLSSTELKSVDFVINRFFMKLFKATNREIIQSCHYYFCFDLTSVMLQKELQNSEINTMSIWQWRKYILAHCYVQTVVNILCLSLVCTWLCFLLLFSYFLLLMVNKVVDIEQLTAYICFDRLTDYMII